MNARIVLTMDAKDSEFRADLTKTDFKILEKLLKNPKEKKGGVFSEADFQRGLGELATLGPNKKLSMVGMLAQQKMIHAALVFYAAAAFQGEGGKAISDGDRKFVEWALAYGAFSTPDQRNYAIQGMMMIIAKSRMINEFISSDDPEKVFIGLRYNDYFGDNVIPMGGMPAEVLEKHPYVLQQLENTHTVQVNPLNPGLLQIVNNNYRGVVGGTEREIVSPSKQLGTKGIVLPTRDTVGLGVSEPDIAQQEVIDTAPFELLIKGNSIIVDPPKINKKNIGGYLKWIRKNDGDIREYDLLKEKLSPDLQSIVDDFTLQGT